MTAFAMPILPGCEGDPDPRHRIKLSRWLPRPHFLLVFPDQDSDQDHYKDNKEEDQKTTPKSLWDHDVDEDQDQDQGQDQGQDHEDQV